ncbi:MAG: hypothetical protein BV458_06430 [Thermoplasmata archaeon M9B2D]|nr:MAG: hypothetical protein BV458_06430 [Thermoplasmata archaeon M9B2D]
MNNQKMISVIIPVLNEEIHLAKTLSSLTIGRNEELIVVDGGSSDRTCEIARQFTSQVFRTGCGRGRQMNYGASKSNGGFLLFLHADCIPPADSFRLIRDTLSRNGVSAGAFDIVIDHPSICFRLIEKGANLRSRITSTPYGDQALFVTRDLFEEIGGFNDIPLMEDISIAGKLKKSGKIHFLEEPVLTSPRRWLEEGLLYTTLRDWSLAISFSVFGVSPRKLINYYRDVR